nr:MAG TPA: hypothetical protein [Caudoviricetes sp.]
MLSTKRQHRLILCIKCFHIKNLLKIWLIYHKFVTTYLCKS